MAGRRARQAKRLGLEPYGISFPCRLASQRKVKAWDRALAMASTVSATARSAAINLSDGQYGRRIPDQVLKDISCGAYGRSIFRALPQAFRNAIRRPSSSRVAAGRQCGIIEPKSFLISKESERGRCALGVSRIGKFRRLAESEDGSRSATPSAPRMTVRK